MKSIRRRLELTPSSSETLIERVDHLALSARLELIRVVKILFEEFDAAQTGKVSEKKTGGLILKLILFDFPEDKRHTRDGRSESLNSGNAGKFHADFKLLIIVNSEFFVSPRIWKRAEERISREIKVTGNLSTQINFLVHSIMYINDHLANGNPFFVQLVQSGYMIYEAPGSLLVEPPPADPEFARKEMRRDFCHWFSSASRRIELAGEAFERGFYREAAFDLHQSVERLYHCVLGVKTMYNPKSHRLAFLRSHAERIAPRLTNVWCDGTGFAKRCFDRLDRAYIGARYSRTYEITREELLLITAGVKALQEAVEATCLEHLSKL
ncbi:HEPN domain-containing protein [Ochrobactrum pseudogrignonense]|uniref:HEPN domain-containing protein n=1 Tax=Brucella pseudogrignonensis TaxID=419475 RepID=A0A7Y3T2F2_9HYPH|nr:HEPN domain-containing protein [Brucella pseudogrignonensis]NNV18890.1 HEPN domain-containing protein [Brucella pseudogrignonensis]